MLKLILITASYMSLFTSFAYADYYLYVDNPDPQNYEINYHDSYNHSIEPSKSSYTTEDGIEHACWHLEDEHKDTLLSIQYKNTKLPVCSFVPTYRWWIGGARGQCLVIKGEAGNTVWLSPKNKADGNIVADPIIRHDCDGTPITNIQ